MPVPVNAIMEAKLHYRANNQECQNVLHYAPPAAGGIGDEITITDTFLDAFNTNVVTSLIDSMTELMSNTVTIYKLTAQLIYPTRFIIRSVNVAYPGKLVGACDNQNIALTVTKRGREANKHNKGSFHLGGLGNQVVAQGRLNAAGFAAKFQTLVEAVKLDVDDPVAGIVWVAAILNKTKEIINGKPHYKVNGRSIVFETLGQNEGRTMHRRTVGLGE